MNFKKTKYNLIFILMLMLIVGVVGFQIYQTTTTPIENVVPQPGQADGEEDKKGDQSDQPGENDPGNQDDQPQQKPSDSDLDSYLTKNKRYPGKIVNYALEKLYSSKGYKSTYEKKMTNDAGIMTVTQNINGTIDKCGNKSLEKLTFKSNSNMGANTIRAFYFDGDRVTHYQTPKGNTTDFSAATVEELNKQEYFQKYILNLADKPIYKIPTANIVSSGSKNNRKYTVINATVDATSLSQNGYTKYYESTGDLTGVTAKSATYTFYIYDDTCQIFQIEGVESMTGKNPQFGVAVDVLVKYTQTFTLFNQEFEIEKPVI